MEASGGGEFIVDREFEAIAIGSGDVSVGEFLLASISIAPFLVLAHLLSSILTY